MENWLQKYQPKKLSDVLIDASQIKQIKAFIKQFTDNDPDMINNPNMIITGTNGIGKTLIVDLAIKEHGLEKIIPDLSNISISRKTKRKKKTEKETIGTNRSVKTYYLSLQNHKNIQFNGEFIKNKIALVFDNVSNISNPKEKEAIKSLVKMNNKLKQFPIFIISNTKHNKVLNDLKKMVTYNVKKNDDRKLTRTAQEKSNQSGAPDEIKKENKKIINEIILLPPDYIKLENFIKNICKKEKLNIIANKSDDENIFSEIIDHTQYDIRRLVNLLEDLKLIYGNEKITLDKFKEYQETSKMKDMDPGIYEATRRLLNQYSSIDEILSIYGEERATIPLMVHENYPLNIEKQYPKMDTKKQIDIMFNISKSISDSDKIDGLIYSNQSWSLQPTHGFYSCVIPSYEINKYPNKRFIREKYRYTQDYNKTSIKKINNKVIKKAQENQYLKKVSINDFLYIATILKSLLERKELEKVAELMKPYDLTVKQIESIIKIDKINKSKNILTGKQKGQMKELLGVDE